MSRVGGSGWEGLHSLRTSYLEIPPATFWVRFQCVNGPGNPCRCHLLSSSVTPESRVCPVSISSVLFVFSNLQSTTSPVYSSQLSVLLKLSRLTHIFLYGETLLDLVSNVDFFLTPCTLIGLPLCLWVYVALPLTVKGFCGP